MVYSNNKVKRLLKSELVKRGISISELVDLLKEVGVYETKSSITSKISRGTFSAKFFLECLSVIGCKYLEIEHYELELNQVAEPKVKYKKHE